MSHRLIGLDTETTGLDFHKGERIVEVALVEMIDRKPTGRRFHSFVNPQRKVGPDAFRVHGLSDRFLADKPLFSQIADEMLNFIDGDDLLIHNAEFDLVFLNGELVLAGKPPLDSNVLDTLEWVKTVEPGKRASLDAMADRHGVDRSDRLLHGALIDAQLLAEVYVAMTREQSGLEFNHRQAGSFILQGPDPATLGLRLQAIETSLDDLLLHQAYLESLGKETKGKCIWLNKTASHLASESGLGSGSAVSLSPSGRLPSP